MKKYYVNKNAQTNGDHEVHTDECYYYAFILNAEFLGYYYSCDEAVKEAKRRGYNANGCKTCSSTCHTT